MRSMIIVDDNKRISAGIRKMLDWESLGIEISQVFYDSKSALKYFEKNAPDIVLTDIIMPEINGIELAEYIKERHPQVKIIFMSCSDDFEYVKSAVYLDIEAYVLKPIVEDELEKAILKTLEKSDSELSAEQEKEKIYKEKTAIIEEMNRFLPVYREHFIREMLVGGMVNDEEIVKRSKFLEMDFENMSYCVMSFIFGDLLPAVSNISNEDMYFISYSIMKAINEYESEDVKVYPFKPYENEIDALVVFDKKEFNKKNIMLDTSVDLNEIITEKFSIPLVIGISSDSDDFSKAKKYQKQAKEATKYNQYNTKTPIIFYEDIQSVFDNMFKEKVDLQVIYNELEDLIMNTSSDKVKTFVKKYFTFNDESPSQPYINSLLTTVMNDARIVLMRISKPLAAVFTEKEEHFNVDFNTMSVTDSSAWVRRSFEIISESLEGSNKLLNEQIVENIKNTIMTRYTESINIEVMLENLPISSGYANVLFKKLTGKTIFNYLTDYRIQVSKKLLSNPKSKVYTVANQVGYLNKSHFCLLFKKSTGLTPSDYKEKFAKLN